MRAAIKDILREIGKTKSRFFSIFAIIAIGAGFFAGLHATCPDMMVTLENYFEEKNLMDIRLVSTYGFNEKDIAAVEKEEDVREIYPTYSKDVFVENEKGENIIAKIMALPEKGMNEVILLEGRLPQNPGECVTESNFMSIGDTVTVYTTDPEDPLSDSLTNESWKIVGKIMSPQYISLKKGSASIGDGVLDSIVMVPEENFTLEVFTEVYLTLNSTKGLGAYDDAYTEKIDEAVTLFEKVGDIREKERYNEIMTEAKEEIADAKQEIADAEKELADAEIELADALKELEDGEKDVKKGWAEYYDGVKEYEEGKETFEKEIADATEELKEAKEELDKAEEQLKEARKELEEGKKEFNDSLGGTSIDEIYEQRREIQKQINYLKSLSESPETAAQIAQLQGAASQLDKVISANEKLEDGEKELEEAEKEFEAGEKEYKKGKRELKNAKKDGEKELEDAKKELNDAYIELKDAEKDLEEGWQEYNDGIVEFNEEKTKADKEIADAKEDIAEAEKDLAELEEPKWHVFTREDTPGYSTYESDVYIIESVGKVFPVFFFLVAMLVCLTTMTRMVEEQRTQVGTMKALGYGKGMIMAKFLVYSAAASVAGAVFGILLCAYVFPEIIYAAYAMMYILPELIHVPQVPVWIIVTAVGLCCTGSAVIMACYAELKESPAQLMRPKAPKAGKRVLLERVGFIWNRMSFIRKVTVRNLFRYKKRIFMTVLGIAGCGALTLTGFGLQSSISVILEKQYNEIFNYDIIVALDTDAGEDEREKAIFALEENEITEKNLPVYIKSAEHKGFTEISLVVTNSPEEIEKMVLFRGRKSGEIYNLTDEGIIITERLAEIAEVSVGDNFTLLCDGVELEAKVTAIAENYASHFVYMTEALYEKLAGKAPAKNAVFTTMTDDTDAAQEKLAGEMLEHEGVLALSFSRTTREAFSDTVENLNYVIVLIILCAAALAFVVLYNLTNINITERVREIATIKVLGFYDGEVSAYVFRENVILAFMGAVVGVGLGVWLHSFVLSVIQTNDIMFGRDLPLWVFAVSFVMTMLFAVLVNWIMYFRLKKISMVESLKSVE